jgi:catecholate siderophore receptor
MRPLRRSIEKSARVRDRRVRRALGGGALGLGLIVSSGPALAQGQVAQQQPAQQPAQQQPAQQQASGDIPLKPVDVRAQRREYRVMEPSLFKFPDLLKDTPQTINVLPQELLHEQGIFSMRDALRNVTGLSLNAGEGGSQGDSLTIRGYAARNDIYLDGVRDWGSYSRDLFNLQSIEVLKGPSATMFGRGSTGGIINQVSKTPEATRFYDVSATIGNGVQGRTTFDLNQPFSPQVAARLNTMFYGGDVPGRDGVDFQRYGVAPSLTIGLSGPTRLTLSYFLEKENNTPDNGLPYLFGQPAPVSRSTFYGLPDNDFFKTTVNIGTVRLDHAFTDDVKLRNTLRYANWQLDQEAVAPRIAGTPTPTTPLSSILVNRGIVARDRTDDILANQTDLIVNFATWGLGHTLTTGVELDRETTDVANIPVTGVPQATLLDPDLFPDLSTIRRAPNTFSGTTAFTASLYAVDEITITPQWKLLGGFRFDHFDADFESRSAVTGVRTAFDRVDDVVSPRAALIFLPTSRQTYYFAWGTSFNPSAEALTLAANTVNTPPEKTQSFELGAKWQLLDGRLSLNAALFRIDKTDARTAEPGSLEQTLDGQQRSQGFEIEVTGRPLPNWNLFAGYTFLDTEVLESKDVQAGIPVQGKRLIAAPQNSFTLWTTYDLGAQWQVGGGVTYVSQRFSNGNNTNSLPGYAKGDLTVAYFPWKSTELRLNLLNVSDARYFDQVYQGHAPPAPGRTALFTVNYRY